MYYTEDNVLENNALKLFNEVKKEHYVLTNRKINIDPNPVSSGPDIGIIVSLVKGINPLEYYDNKTDSILHKIIGNSTKLDVPKQLRKKCLSKKDFKGKVFNVIKWNQKSYIEIKLVNNNFETLFFVFEFDDSGKYQRYYHKYLIY